MNLFRKLISLFKKPCVILVVGKNRVPTVKVISQFLTTRKFAFDIFESTLSEEKVLKKFSFLFLRYRLPILVVTRLENKEESIQIRKLVKTLPDKGFLLLNFDDDRARELRKSTLISFLTYGFYKKADLRATDLHINSEGVNFKVDYQGSIVPFWLKNISEKEELYNILAAVAVGIILNINLVEISQKLKAL